MMVLNIIIMRRRRIMTVREYFNLHLIMMKGYLNLLTLVSVNSHFGWQRVDHGFQKHNEVNLS